MPKMVKRLDQTGPLNTNSKASMSPHLTDHIVDGGLEVFRVWDVDRRRGKSVQRRGCWGRGRGFIGRVKGVGRHVRDDAF